MRYVTWISINNILLDWNIKIPHTIPLELSRLDSTRLEQLTIPHSLKYFNLIQFSRTTEAFEQDSCTGKCNLIIVILFLLARHFRPGLPTACSEYLCTSCYPEISFRSTSRIRACNLRSALASYICQRININIDTTTFMVYRIQQPPYLAALNLTYTWPLSVKLRKQLKHHPFLKAYPIQ